MKQDFSKSAWLDYTVGQGEIGKHAQGGEARVLHAFPRNSDIIYLASKCQ